MEGLFRKCAAFAASVAILCGAPRVRGEAPADSSAAQGVGDFVQKYCLDCHSGEAPDAGLALDRLPLKELQRNASEWEKVIRRLDRREMPPEGALRPSEAEYLAATCGIAAPLDREAEEHPRPGRTATLRRMTRSEYQYAIRDLLDLEINAAEFLPADEISHGFDNVTVTELPPALLNRYLLAARAISALALGHADAAPESETFRVRPDITQDGHLEGLPLGTRGGTLIHDHFPQAGEYEFQVHLMRDRNEELEGLRESHELELLVDNQKVTNWTIAPPRRGEGDKSVDANLKVRTRVSAGPHRIGVTFRKKPSTLLESMRQPLNVHFNYYRHPRLGPAVYQVTITGPFDAAGPGDTPSRRKILIVRPETPEAEEACAQRILAQLTRRAYRRPISEADLATPWRHFREGQASGGFEYGIELALGSVLVSPQFLFRIERNPPDVTPGGAYRVSDIELASRLSFFLWSSIPDDELLALAEREELHRPEVLDRQTRRMLADPKSRSLVENFAGQWLHLRNLESITPDMRLFPDFDDNLRQAMRRETELLIERMIREDRSVIDLLSNDDTFLNERLAKHYGVPQVFGSRFRTVALTPADRRGGLLRQASILTVTSYATRTSPVLRGKWVLDNLLGSPPPPPPPTVPALEDNTVAANLTVRERLASHRAHAACAQCHARIDPIGFALENFDAVGHWRDLEDGRPVDAAGGMAGHTNFVGASGLESALRDRKEIFVQTLTEKLLTFALGRGMETSDAPSVRQILRESRREQHRFSSVVIGIVRSAPFQMRSAE